MNLTATFNPPRMSVTVNAPAVGVSTGSPVARDYVEREPYIGEYAVTPTEDGEVLSTNGLRMTDDVTVEAIPSDYIGSEVPRVGHPLPTTRLTSAAGTVTAEHTQETGYCEGGTTGATIQLTVKAGETITPTESEQTAVPQYRWTTGAVKVDAIPSDYVGSAIDRRSSSDLTASGATVSVPSGYYASAASKAVQSGSVSVADKAITANPDIQFSSGTGHIEVSVSESESVNPTVSAGYVSSGTGGTVTVSGSNSRDLPTQAGTTVNPTESEQTAVDAYKWTTGAVKVGAISSTYIGSGVAQKSAADLTASGKTVTAPAGYYAEDASKDVATGSRGNGTVYISTTSTKKIYTLKHEASTSGYYPSSALQTDGTVEFTRQTESVTPTESAQTVTPTNSTYMLESVSVDAIPSDYVGSGITQRDSSDLSASGATVTAPAGYYASDATKSVSSGSATPAASIMASSASKVIGNGEITLSKTVANTPQVSAGYVASGTQGNTNVSLTAAMTTRGAQTLHPSTTDQTIASATYLTGTQTVKAVTHNLLAENIKDGVTLKIGDSTDDDCVASVTGSYTGGGGTPNLQAKTNIDPTTSSQTITADTGYDGLSSVQINAMPSGTEGTPTATKGTVSNHAISVTPSVTNAAGYISGGTHNGTAVSVAASELVSGTKSITASGNTDVTNYATASVASGGATASASKGTVSNHSITVTPSVTKTAGYITAGTSNGTAVTVSASELVSGSETKTANGTYDVTNLAELVVNVSGGGGSGWTSISSTELAVNTTSTSAASAGTVALGSSAYTADKIIYVRIRDKSGKRNGYFYGSDTYFMNWQKANGSTTTLSVVAQEYYRYNNSALTGAAGAYGVYGYSISSSGTLTIRRRYNSTNTLTINSTYTIDVYTIDPPKALFG